MWSVHPGNITQTAKEFVEEWLQKSDAGSSYDDLPVRILSLLKLAGFSGCGEHLKMENGYFFPNHPINQKDEVFAAIATGIQMVHGSPALLLKRNNSKIHDCCGVGLFVGPIQKNDESINVG
jgi:hypothetical protein